jgi:hypothetical protein
MDDTRPAPLRSSPRATMYAAGTRRVLVGRIADVAAATRGQFTGRGSAGAGATACARRESRVALSGGRVGTLGQRQWRGDQHGWRQCGPRKPPRRDSGGGVAHGSCHRRCRARSRQALVPAVRRVCAHPASEWAPMAHAAPRHWPTCMSCISLAGFTLSWPWQVLVGSSGGA